MAFLVVHFCCAAPPFLQSKNLVFEVHQGGCWCAKVWFMKCKKGVFVFRMRNNHEINELQTNYDDVASKL